MKDVSAAAGKVDVAVVEDDASTVTDLKALLSRTPGIRLLREFPNAEEALEQFPFGQVKVALVDIQLPKMSGIECARHLCAHDPKLLVLMLTVCEDDERLFQSLAAGATGFILKRESEGAIVDAIWTAVNGGAPMTPSIARRVVRHFMNPKRDSTVRHPLGENQLSPREQELLDLVAEGYSYKECGDRLGISPETVKTHLRRVYRKLQVPTGAAAIAKFYQTKPKVQRGQPGIH
ncbi:MAG: response regulator transcription factor [Verrucomicrobiales bacterium]|nr:response regulator transcription factor [Verrucomicrobiales bacterium]